MGMARATPSTVIVFLVIVMPVLRSFAQPAHPAPPPTTFALDPQAVRYVVTHGIGGNYCFEFDSPVTAITLRELKPPVVRTEMVLREWEAENDNDDPATANWDYYRSRDVAELRARFEFMADLTRRQVPYAVAVWGAPPWIRQGRGPVERAKWPELIEGVSTFLEHAKAGHGAEPDFFTFNEPDYGVDVKLSPEEHRDMIKLLGAEFERHGLRTKLTLGDAHKPAPIEYVQPAAADPEAMRHVGVVAFHSWWYEDKPEHLSQWADLAERVKRPLWVAEAGVNAIAWRDGSMNTFDYAIGELVHYQRLLIHARPQAILYWEYTGDYSLLDAQHRPTERFAFMRHWSEFIPPGSEAMAGEERDGLLFTAFRDPATRRVALHLANPTAGPRGVRVTGLPDGLTRLDCVTTSRAKLFVKTPGPTVDADHTLVIDLPAQSLVTLHAAPASP